MWHSVIGQCLLWIGFLGAALTAVLRLEDQSNPWSTISWPFYLVWMLVGWAGVAVLRWQRVQLNRSAADSWVGLESVLDKLKLCSTEIDKQLVSQLDDLTCEQVLERIDSQLAPLMNDFAEDSKAIAQRLGSAAFSQIMSEFASGERYLNRAWSAAADGYVDEVTRSVRIAGEFLRAAVVHATSAMHSASVSRPV